MQTSPQVPLTLHTIPSTLNAKSAIQSTKSLNRLVSIVEIIKREWTRARQSARRKESDEKRDEDERKADRLPTRLHQYTELVHLEKMIEEAESMAEDESRTQQRHDEAIAQVTSGRKHPKKTHSPGLIVTLSLQPLSVATGATHQAPPPKERLRGRARKRKRRREAEQGQGDAGETLEQGPVALEGALDTILADA